MRCLLSLLCMLGSLVCTLTAWGAGPVFNVRDYGAQGDGITDDTAALQALLQQVPSPSEVYWPAGTYLVRATRGLQMAQTTGITWRGDGAASVIQRHPSAHPTARLATLTACTRFVIEELAFDANGITSYGGVYLAQTVQGTIRRTHFFDSNPLPVGQTDRYAYVAVGGSALTIWDNIIHDLQVEMDGLAGAIIAQNTIVRPVRTAAIGVFYGPLVADYVISGNHIIDAVVSAGAITVDIDPPSRSRTTYRRIMIAYNTIEFTAPGRRAILIGTPDNSQSTAGNSFEDIAVIGNTIHYKGGIQVGRDAMLWNSSPRANFDFVRPRVLGNTLTCLGSCTGRPFDIRRSRDGLIGGNSVTGWAHPPSVQDLGGTVILDGW